MRILNIGAGKVDVRRRRKLITESDFTIYLDRSYAVGTPIHELESKWEQYNEESHVYYCNCFCNMDVFEFLDSWKFQFDKIIADRIFEHMFYDSGEIGRLLDACNQITTDDGLLEIVVPNHYRLSCLAADIEVSNNKIRNDELLLINTEFMNTRCDPHGSYWSPLTARTYVENEGGTWQIDNIQEPYTHKGRDIYMKIWLSKPKEKDTENEEK